MWIQMQSFIFCMCYCCDTLTHSEVNVAFASAHDQVRVRLRGGCFWEFRWRVVRAWTCTAWRGHRLTCDKKIIAALHKYHRHKWSFVILLTYGNCTQTFSGFMDIHLAAFVTISATSSTGAAYLAPWQRTWQHLDVHGNTAGRGPWSSTAQSCPARRSLSRRPRKPVQRCRDDLARFPPSCWLQNTNKMNKSYRCHIVLIILVWHRKVSGEQKTKGEVKQSNLGLWQKVEVETASKIISAYTRIHTHTLK